MVTLSLKQRSSWASSLLTGLIGWNGFILIVGLALGSAMPAGALFGIASVAALAQVVVLRMGFFALGMARSLRAGALWGGASGLALIAGALGGLPALRQHSIVWALTALYIGGAVGIFLAYFYRDDRRIEAEAQVSGAPVDYGRDAHWLEPFAFGAIAYLAIFLPRSVDLAIAALIVGAMGGVVAAGISHFLLFTSGRTSTALLILGAVGGLTQGALSGLLFRQYDAHLSTSPLALGALAGALTYLITGLRGRALARREVEPKAGGTA